MTKFLNSVSIILFCLLILTQASFAQMSAPIDLGLLNGKDKMLEKPEYSETAKKSGVGGAVRINVTVDGNGNVIKAEAVSGEMLLRDSALAAARASKFLPNLVNGKPAKMRGFLVFNFVVSTSGSTSSSDPEFADLSAFVNSTVLDQKTEDALKEYKDGLKNGSQKKSDDPFDFKKNSNALREELNKIGKSENSSKDSQSAAKNRNSNKCMGELDFFVFTTMTKSEWVSLETVKNYIKICDEAVKIDPAQQLPYYNRGISRYYLTRGFGKPLIKTMSEAEAVSAEDLRLSLADLQIYIQKQVEYNDKSKNGLASEELKMAYLAAGELKVVFGVKTENEEMIQSAFVLWTAGEKLKTLADAYDKNINSVIAADRDILNQMLAEYSKQMSNSTPNVDEAKVRYQKYSGEYAALESGYKTKVQNFQEILKVQQGVSNPDTVKVCQSLSEMNTAFESMKNSFAKISEIKNKGELSDANLVKQIEMREAQQAKMQTNISGAAAKFGCQLK